MKKIKKIIGAVLAVTFIVGIMTMQTFAYSDGDRKVLYHNFTLGNGELVKTSSDSMKRLYNREWVVTVQSVRNNQYAITYGIIDNNASEWYNSLVSYTTSRNGTGNFGGKYYGSDTVGSYLYLGAMIDERDVNRGVVTSGQWSTDAAK